MPLGGFALARNDKTGELPRRRGRPLDGPFPFRYAPRGVVGAAPYDFFRRRDGSVGTALSRPRCPARTSDQ